MKQKRSGLSRRNFMLAATATAAVSSLASNKSLSARDYGVGTQPVRYPDPDIVVIEDEFSSYKQGNAAIMRLYHDPEMIWAEGCAWNGVGRYLVWSDIPNNTQLRWMEEDCHV
ncbi:MAG: hypothetical protein MK324_12085 [Pirellulales bacterium]|nr:hypothetical protein [Pirellulales bacterium]